MTRVLSAAVLLTVVIGTVWFLPPVFALVLALIAAALAFVEYAALARALGAEIPRGLSGTAVLAACAAMAATGFAVMNHDLILVINGWAVPRARMMLDIVLMSATIAIGAAVVGSRTPGPAVLADMAASLLPMLYIGLPLGALVGLLAMAGRAALLLLAVIIIVSDSAQYYTGRALGRRPLAPAISPKKTVEGAIGGIVFGTAAAIIGGGWVFATTNPLVLGLLGATISALGIVGDLFESLLKRSAGVKDSGTLIPGHGGVLDRIDSWLFAAPVYYTFVLYLQ